MGLLTSPMDSLGQRHGTTCTGGVSHNWWTESSPGADILQEDQVSNHCRHLPFNCGGLEQSKHPSCAKNRGRNHHESSHWTHHRRVHTYSLKLSHNMSLPVLDRCLCNFRWGQAFLSRWSQHVQSRVCRHFQMRSSGRISSAIGLIIGSSRRPSVLWISSICQAGCHTRWSRIKHRLCPYIHHLRWSHGI